MKALFVAFAILALTSAIPLLRTEEELLNLWESWKQEYEVGYQSSGEEAYRFSVFLNNYYAIHEQMEKDPFVELSLNKFATYTQEEFGALMKCTERADTLQCNGEGSQCPQYPTNNLPDSWDWRDKGAVSPVKNQGSCGSCWAFSTTGALEGLNYLNTSKMVTFSEQQLVDCDNDVDGCNGGLMDDALMYASKFGIETEATYPYRGVDGECKYSKSDAQMVNTGCNCVEPKSIEQLQAAVVQQPVSIAVQANQVSWQFYTGGVISSFCGDQLDHGVLAVGYAQEKGKDAWIVKNSWGPNWGNAGYVYIERNTKNNGDGSCGVLAQPMVPVNAN